MKHFRGVSNFQVVFVFVAVLLFFSSPLLAGSCVISDNGTGTVTLPPIGCEYLSPDEVLYILDGLPPGTTIELEPILKDFICLNRVNCSMIIPPGVCETTGGDLGGSGHCFTATLELNLMGTGDLAGYNRTIIIPVEGEIHTGPRNPGDPVQTFDAQFHALQGGIFGDPDFDTLSIKWGDDLNLPSPGSTTLTDLGDGTFNVDSFFDITYEIDFTGAVGGTLDGLSGTTNGSIRMQTGETIVCEVLPDGSGCSDVTCPVAGNDCVPSTVNYDPVTGLMSVIDCSCRAEGACQVDISSHSVYSCELPDNGNETADLPAFGCEYYSPDEVFMIIDGLPAGTTIELDGPLSQLSCPIQHVGCSITMPPDICERPGGTLGGMLQCFDASLEFDVMGTGDLTGFSRTISIPVNCETHSAARTPGDPVQTFNADFYRLHGELLADPDFSVLQITGGTDNGLPSPGSTSLIQLPSGDFAVDSFFDITYQIDFTGSPGSVLEGFSGTTTGTIRMRTPVQLVQPGCMGDCPPDSLCYESVSNNPDGTIDISCDCVPLIASDIDYYATPIAEVDFADEPIPADFFGPGSDPFDGIIAFKGRPIESGSLYDTKILRDDIILADPPPMVSIELVELNLVSVEPVRVTFNGGMVDSFFDVMYEIDPGQSSPGSLIPDSDSVGGLFDMSLNIQPRLTFVELGNPANVFAYYPNNAVSLLGADYSWQPMPLEVVRPPCEGPGFFPSGIEPLNMSSASGTTYHDITPRDPMPMDFNEDGSVDFIDFARFASRWLDLE